jgi:hypothetical protein
LGSREDAQNELGDGLPLSGVERPNLAGYYVTVDGVLHAAGGAATGGGPGPLDFESRGIFFWSDPAHPMGNPKAGGGGR